jgi:lipoprotein-anchoring transpeptidase ErfK/SrfK
MSTAPPVRAALVAVGAALAVTLTACGGGGSHHKPAAVPSPALTQPAAASAPELGQAPSTIATATGPTVEIYPQPGAATPTMTLHSPNPDGVKRVFLVEGTSAGWLHVLLPVPPNGSEGWIPAGSVSTATTPYWIQVIRSRHRLEVHKGGSVVLDAPAGIGTQDTPTPGGLYYVTELLKAPNPAGAYGPYAYGLSGYSTSLKQFQGHDPIIGIHGTDQPKLVGTDVSHGCVRVGNDVITRMAAMLPLGTPVRIDA